VRLHLKITLWVVAIFLIVGGFSIYALVLFQRAATLQQFEAMAKTLTATILNSLTSTMVNNNPSQMQQIIGHVEQEPVIHRVTIYGPDGRVWASSRAEEVGISRPSALLARVIASRAPAAEERPESGELLVLTPILNRAECGTCHAADGTVLGAIGVSLGTGHVAAQLRSTAKLLAGLVGFTFLLALGTLSVLLGRVVLDPLSAMVRAVREISRGNYGARASVTTGDELGVLAAAFNDMSARIERYTTALSEEISDLTRRLSTLTVFSKTLTAAADLTSALNEAAAAMREALRADTCLVYGRQGGTLRPIATAGEATLVTPAGVAVANELAGRPLSTPDGPADIQRPVVGAGAVLAVPMRTRDQDLGAVIVARAEERPFERSDLILLSTVANQLAIAIENVRLFEEVREKERLRRDLLSRLISAHEDERFRISRELHDEVSQSLTGLMMRLNAAEEMCPQDLEQARAALGTVRGVAEQTLEEVRKIIFALRPTLLDDLGLIPAVRHYAKNLLEPAGLQVRFSTGGFGGQRLPRAIETTVFRIAQEAVTNIARHAQASRATISVELTDGTVRLLVADDGVGFDVEAALRDPALRRLGIIGMEERVALLGGTLRITSRPGEGTTVEMALPLGIVAAAAGV
jgi:signal transduction histidine kinase